MSALQRALPRTKILVPGKWVLAGEHAVLRGRTAVALPREDIGLELRFEPCGSRLESADVVLELVELAGALSGERLGADSRELAGRLTIASSIPIGAGLGSSAALCVALTRWLAGPLRLHSRDQVAFATQLENRFHGKSSGMDVAAISACRPIQFSLTGGACPIPVSRLPRFTFHDTGLRASTRECVARVQEWVSQDLARAEYWDDRMQQAAFDGARGLEAYSAGREEAGLECVAAAMSLSHDCLEEWGLVPPQAGELMRKLRGQGALAAKLTGAGAGGFVVALWG